MGGDGARIGDSEDELTAAWRSATSDLGLLLVLDDAVDARQVRPQLPSGPGSTVIVSSRRRLAGPDATRRISLAPLPDGDSLRLFGSLVGADRAEREPDVARALVRLCDGPPLALRILGARLQTRPDCRRRTCWARRSPDVHGRCPPPSGRAARSDTSAQRSGGPGGRRERPPARSADADPSGHSRPPGGVLVMAAVALWL
ncbi:NB-ARC domain-containing protein [Streptomyces sp. NPDC056362]|uniref:NB-ARC domain-containing protein n=1 Tax=unclassified Streptomyces TaxID=2593676 RepID=UPI0035E1AB94